MCFTINDTRITADVQPLSLLPSNSQDGARSLGGPAGKRVDLGLVLRYDDYRHVEDVAHAIDPAYPSINHSIYPPIRERPLILSIETKVDGGIEDGRIQLAIWAHAHFAKLKQLTTYASGDSNISIDLPALPLLLVTHHDWKLLVAKYTEQELVSQTISDVELFFFNSCYLPPAITDYLRTAPDWKYADYVRAIPDHGGLAGYRRVGRRRIQAVV